MACVLPTGQCIERRTFIHVIDGDEDSKDVRSLRRSKSLGDIQDVMDTAGNLHGDVEVSTDAAGSSPTQETCSAEAILEVSSQEGNEQLEDESGQVGLCSVAGEGSAEIPPEMAPSYFWYWGPTWQPIYYEAPTGATVNDEEADREATAEQAPAADVEEWQKAYLEQQAAAAQWWYGGMPTMVSPDGSWCTSTCDFHALDPAMAAMWGLTADPSATAALPSAATTGDEGGGLPPQGSNEVAVKGPGLAERDGGSVEEDEANELATAGHGDEEQEGSLITELADDAVTVLYMAAQKDASGELGVEELVLTCLQPLPRVRCPSMVAKLLWSLGKLEVQSPEVSTAVRYVANMVKKTPTMLKQLGPHELSKALWGMARLAPTRSARNRSWAKPEEGLSLALIIEITARVQQLTPQCLSNALWAVARLETHHSAVHRFARACANAFCAMPDLSGFTSQGLANVLWAFARLCVALKEAGTNDGRAVCRAAVLEAQGRLKQFQPQELSMLAWAVAKIHGRGRTSVRASRANATSSDLVNVLLQVADIAAPSLHLFTPQGISNIAWSMAKMDVLNYPEVQKFMLTTSAHAAPSLHDYPPQAIANLLWAVGQLPNDVDDPDSVLTEIAAAAARQAYQRMKEFGWQDLAGVAVALSHGRHTIPEALAFVAEAMSQAAWYCREARVMLNIALAAARLGMVGQEYQELVEAIQNTWDPSGWSSEDLRQWSKVQQHLAWMDLGGHSSSSLHTAEPADAVGVAPYDESSVMTHENMELLHYSLHWSAMAMPS
mmetsp:Transcript_14418/g.34029  ORF Transcript_14418/g.34029 Transcript_14418/m.34029 type:complete len:779 (+) Transcript_14418:111-2447(+)